jgi:hypothetical protein
MISAISEMLWEDVFCQSKRVMTDCIGQEDIAFSQKKVQSAADMLRVAFIDFYRGLGMLKSSRFHTFSTFEAQSARDSGLGYSHLFSSYL